jgi:tRNA modification GTPase
MDLAQAEAIRDLIHARTGYQAQLAARQLRGELSRQLQPLKQRLIDLIVHLESAVEFVEDDLDPLNLARLTAEIADLGVQLTRLTDSFRYGRIVRNGLRMAIIGRPNVGKSSLFNALLGRDRAIVTEIPGTTRDTLSEAFALRGIPVELVDTAGIRETDDRVEQLGVERTRSTISEADLVLAVLDASSATIEGDPALNEESPVHFFVLNKSDLGLRLPDEVLQSLSAKAPLLSVSALTGEGIEQLKDQLHMRIAGLDGSLAMLEAGAIITSERHFAALNDALTALRKARADLEGGFTEEIALANLHAALRSLGVITGETLIGDIIHQIFATFCIGK